MDKIMEKINKLSLPVVILIASVILGGFYYASQVNKQRSIERQQEIKIVEERRTEEAKAEQVKKEYIAKRKNECYSIYEKESSNGSGQWSEYDEENDVCLVSYREIDESKVDKCAENTLKKLPEKTWESCRGLL